MTSRAGDSKIERAAACEAFWAETGEVWTNLLAYSADEGDRQRTF